MLMLRSVLCPVDFSDQSLHALRWAVALAAQNQSRLIVLTAIEPLLAEAARARLGLDLAKADTQPALREFVKAALPEAAAWLPETAFDVRIGDPSEMILEAATREHADLIAVGTYGLGGFRKFLLGSTTERVLRRTSTAVLAAPLVKTQSVVLETDGPRFDLQRILMGTDFSEVSTEALRWATRPCAATQGSAPAFPRRDAGGRARAMAVICCRGRRGTNTRSTNTARDAHQAVERDSRVGGRRVARAAR
jgi:nucleotide-binding universal stress UspA family protein